MEHRHLDHSRYTLAGIDSVIGRGTRHDWRELRKAAREDPELLERIHRICVAHRDDPYDAPLYERWQRWVDRQRPLG